MKNSKIEHFSDLLREQNLPIACVTSPANIFYLTGFHCEPHERLLCLFVFPEDEPILVCPAMEMNAAKNAGWKNSIIGYTDAEDPWKNIGKELRKRKKTFSHIAIEADHLTVTRMKQVKFILPEAELHSIDNILLNMRLIKDDSEIEKMREAAKIADLAITAGVEALKEGISEIDVLSSIEANMKKNGVQKIPFDLIVLFGKKAADPHGVPGINTLKKGDFVLFDIGASYERYCSDMTRTFIFGSATDEQIEMYNTVLKAEEAAINQCKPGEIIGEIDKTARNIIKENGYGEYFLHRTGHGLGIEVHEIPSIHEKNEDILQEGMVITIEPGIYNLKIGGVRIEDDVVITNDGVEVLTKYPKELQIIG